MSAVCNWHRSVCVWLCAWGVFSQYTPIPWCFLGSFLVAPHSGLAIKPIFLHTQYPIKALRNSDLSNGIIWFFISSAGITQSGGISAMSDHYSTIYWIWVTDVPVIKVSAVMSLLMGFGLSFQSCSPLLEKLFLCFILNFYVFFFSENVNKQGLQRNP